MTGLTHTKTIASLAVSQRLLGDSPLVQFLGDPIFQKKMMARIRITEEAIKEFKACSSITSPSS